MTPFRILFLTILLTPLLEIYLLIRVGEVIGGWPTVLMVVVMAVLGVALIRIQGFSTLRRLQGALLRGESPAMGLLEGMVIMAAGVLLLIPGFFTDVIGLLCLVPMVRRALIAYLLRHHVFISPGRGPRDSGQGPRTLEGEYRRED